MSIVDKLKAFGHGLNEYYSAPYRATFARARQEEDFHAWHRRMGMLRSPLEEIQCC